MNTGFLQRIFSYSSRIRLNTEQNVLVLFLNKFLVYLCTRTLWIHVTRIPFMHIIQIYENTGNYTNIRTYTSFGILFEYLNNGFCIMPYCHKWYNVVYWLRIFRGLWKLEYIYPGSLSEYTGNVAKNVDLL